eukprot:scaffold3079_cov187-Ochromonas_danica.AAC.15
MLEDDLICEWSLREEDRSLLDEKVAIVASECIGKNNDGPAEEINEVQWWLEFGESRTLGS